MFVKYVFFPLIASVCFVAGAVNLIQAVAKCLSTLERTWHHYYDVAFWTWCFGMGVIFSLTIIGAV